MANQPTPSNWDAIADLTGPPSASRGKRTARGQFEQAIDLLYRQRWVILACFFVGVALAVYYTSQRAPIYSASAIVMLDQDRMPGGSTAGVGIEGTPFVRSDRSLTTELFILQNSYALSERVATKLRLMSDSVPGVTFPPRGMVDFQPASRSVASAIRINAMGTNPKEVEVLANVYAEAYVAQTRAASLNYVSSERGFLEEQAAKHREALRSAEENLEAYLKRTGSVGLGSEGSRIVNQLAALEVQRDESQIELQMRRANLEAVERELGSIHPRLATRVASDVDVRMETALGNIQRLEAERREITTYQSGAGASDRAKERLSVIDAQIRDLRSEVDQLSKRYVEEALSVGGMDASTSGAISYAAELKRQAIQERIAIQGIEARASTVESRLGAYQSELSLIPAKSTDLARLERDRRHAEQMYQYVIGQLQSAEIREQSDPGYARVLRQASVPVAPVGPNRAKDVGFGTLFGLLLGLGLGLLRERLDNRFRQPDDLADAGAKVIGVIPDMSRRMKEVFGDEETAQFGDARVVTSLGTLLDPLSPGSEAYRHLRTALQFSRPDRVVQTVLVTSAAPGEGKSTTAANLAIAYSQAQRRVLLIDADLRRPRQHALFGIEHGLGLLQALYRGQNLDAFAIPGVDGLHVLPAGAVLAEPANAAEAQPPTAEWRADPAQVLGTKRMRELLARAREHYDVIIIDTPPVLVASEGIVLATQVDAAVMVARAGSTKEGDFTAALQLLDDVGAPVVGAVLNGFDLSMAYGYRYSYSHYSKYGPYSAYNYGTEQPKKRKGLFQRMKA